MTDVENKREKPILPRTDITTTTSSIPIGCIIAVRL